MGREFEDRVERSVGQGCRHADRCRHRQGGWRRAACGSYNGAKQAVGLCHQYANRRQLRQTNGEEVAITSAEYADTDFIKKGRSVFINPRHLWLIFLLAASSVAFGQPGAPGPS